MRSLCVLGLLAACGGGGGFPDAKPIDSPAPTGTFSLAWTVDDSGSMPVACDKIGAQTVTVLAHNRAFDGGTTEVFTCATGSGTSQALPAGTYDFDFQLTSASGTLATSATQHGIELVAGQNTPLTPITFTVDATGGLSLMLTTNRTDGNCAPPTGGGGIMHMSITLVRASDLGCEPVTFMRSSGGTYTVNCTTPADAGCIDATESLSVMGVPSDTYIVHVKGMIDGAGNTTCWTNNDSLQVPAQGMSLTKTLNLAYSTGAPGC